jgi:cytoskeletal protein RodZ
MDPEDKELLKATYKLAEENNAILKKMRRNQRIASLLRVLYWVIVIGIGVGIFYFIQPYVDSVTNFFKETGDTIEGIKNTFSN